MPELTERARLQKAKEMIKAGFGLGDAELLLDNTSIPENVATKVRLELTLWKKWLNTTMAFLLLVLRLKSSYSLKLV